MNMKALKRISIFAVFITVLLVTAVPSFAAQAGTIDSISQSGCTVNVTVTTTGDAGTYRLLVLDGGLQYALVTFAGSMGQTQTVSFPVLKVVDDDPIAPGAGSGVGVGIYLMDADGFSFADILDVDENFTIFSSQECQDAYFAALCAQGSIPEGSVVGALPNAQLAYYAPGLATGNPQVILNPGTYWVVDVRDGFYQIILACQLLWVPIETMGPNFDEVWFGRPLPTISLR